MVEKSGRGTDDEVDLIVDAWARLRPDVDFTPLDVMSRLRRVALRLGNLRKETFSDAGLAIWEFDVLAALRRADPPHELSPARLMQSTMVGSATMSNRLEILTNRGLITRRDNPADGRSNFASLTPDGLARVDAAMVALVAREDEELSALSRAERSELARVLRVLGDGRSSG